MKKYLLLCLIIITALNSEATTITAVKNGDWETASTWNLSNWGAGKDTVIIPFGFIISVTSNVDMGSLAIVLEDYGVLSFIGSGSKLNLSPASTVIVNYTGLITATGSPSQVLKIGNNTVYKGNEANVFGLSYATSTSPGFIVSTVLPVRFTDISVNRENHGIMVQWTTAQETGSSSFEIERSLDGNNWTKAGTVAAAGNSTTTRSYSFTDQNNNTQVYYRIKEVDANGAFIYSTVKSVSAVSESAGTVSISSTASGKVLLQFHRTVTGNYIVRIVSLSGQVVNQQQLSSPAGSVFLSYTCKGTYVVTVCDGKSLQQARQVIL